MSAEVTAAMLDNILTHSGKKFTIPVRNAMANAMRLLKDQEPVAPVPNETLQGLGWDDAMNCGACGNQLRRTANFCDQCGRCVKW